MSGRRRLRVLQILRSGANALEKKPVVNTFARARCEAGDLGVPVPSVTGAVGRPEGRRGGKANGMANEWAARAPPGLLDKWTEQIGPCARSGFQERSSIDAAHKGPTSSCFLSRKARQRRGAIRRLEVVMKRGAPLTLRCRRERPSSA
jgi:hypothetical protein